MPIFFELRPRPAPGATSRCRWECPALRDLPISMSSISLRTNISRKSGGSASNPSSRRPASFCRIAGPGVRGGIDQRRSLAHIFRQRHIVPSLALPGRRQKTVAHNCQQPGSASSTRTWSKPRQARSTASCTTPPSTVGKPKILRLAARKVLFGADSHVGRGEIDLIRGQTADARLRSHRHRSGPRYPETARESLNHLA